MNFTTKLILLILAGVVALAQYDGQSQQQQTNQQFPYGQPPLPPFLYNASAEARRQFFSIAYNPNLPIVQINAQLEQWSKQQPKDVQDAFNAQLRIQKQMEAKMNEERGKLLNALPADAKMVAMKLDAIRENLQLTPNQQMKQASEILQNTDANIREQLIGVDQKLGQMMQQIQQQQQQPEFQKP